MLFRAAPWFDTELSTAERAELAAITCEVPDVDLESWKSLAKLEKRRTNVHPYVISMSQIPTIPYFMNPDRFVVMAAKQLPLLGFVSPA